MRRDVLVVGLGRFGAALALELTSTVHGGLAVDRSEQAASGCDPATCSSCSGPTRSAND